MKTYADLAQFFGIKMNKKFRIRFTSGSQKGGATIEYIFRENGIYKFNQLEEIEAYSLEIINLIMTEEIVYSPWIPLMGDEVYIIDPFSDKGYVAEIADECFFSRIAPRNVRFFETELEAFDYIKDVLKWTVVKYMPKAEDVSWRVPNSINIKWGEENGIV
jgi:hypothetical protein